MNLDPPPRKMLLIRADADETMGAGHVMRCIALAQEWKRNYGDVLFVSACPSAIENKLTSLGFKVTRIDAPFPCESDLETTLTCIKKDRACWTILDGYHFTAAYHDKIRASGVKLLVLDDYNHLPEYRADMILNQNLGARAFEYNTPETTISLKGSQFAMLRDEFTSHPQTRPDIPDRAEKILITTGGADPDNLTLKIAKALNRVNSSRLKIKIIIGPANPNIRSIENELGTSRFECEIISNTHKMPDLMAWADMAISAGGSTAWELSYFGVPSIFIIMADNQEKIVQALEAAYAGINAGRHTRITEKDLARHIINLSRDHDQRRRISAAGRKLITRKGRERVAMAMASFLTGTRLDITILSDNDSWILPYADRLKTEIQGRFPHSIRQIHSVLDIKKGDIVFYLGCGQLVPKKILDLNTHNLVVHESALPRGKGWSPMTWQILEKENEIPITLAEAVEKVDSGIIYRQDMMRFKGHELVEELREIQGEASIRLCLDFLTNYPTRLSGAREQKGRESFYPRRTPENSRLDINKSIADQFNLMRVADNKKYPLFFEINGQTFQLQITKAEGTK